MSRTILIAVSIIFGAWIIGESIKESNLTESARAEINRQKIEQSKADEESRIAYEKESEVRKQHFFQDVFERIVNAQFSELKFSEKLIYGFLKLIFTSYFFLSIFSAMLLFYCFSIRIKPFHFNACELSKHCIAILSYGFCAALLFGLIASLGTILIALSYKLVEVVITLYIGIILSVAVGVFVVQQLSDAYDYLDTKGVR